MSDAPITNSTAAPRLDGALLNVLTGMGVAGRDKSAATKVNLNKGRISKEEKEQLFAVRILRKICTVFPTEAVRKGWLVKLGGEAKDPKIISAFDDYQRRLKIKAEISWAKILANAYDGAAIVLNVDDGQPPDQPIRKDRIRTIKNLNVLDRYKIHPELINYDPLNPDYYELVLDPGAAAKMRAEIGLQDTKFRIHPDRVLRFDGVELLPDQMLENQGWGGSVLEQMLDTFKLWDTSHHAISDIIQNFDVMVYGLKGLAQLIKAGEQKTLSERLDSLKQTNSVFGGIAIDADSETLTSYTRNVSGLPPLGDMFRDRLIGESEVSHTFLFGESPSGLGATGESEEKTDAKKVHAFQEDVYRPVLEHLFELIWLSKDGPTKGKIPDDWSFEFVSLLDERLEEKINARSTQANTDRTWIDTGVLLPEEVRQSRFGGSEYSFETVLDDSAWQKKQQEQANAFDFGGFEEPSAETLQGNTAMASEEEEVLPPQETQLDSLRLDVTNPIKHVINWQGLSIGVTHTPGDRRFPGLLSTPMGQGVSYGHIRRSYGAAPDRKALDVYLHKSLQPNLYKIRQIDPDTGFIDEPKYAVGFESIESARETYLAHAGRDRFGGIEPVDISELAQYRDVSYHQDACECEKCQLLDKLKKKKKKRKVSEEEIVEGVYKSRQDDQGEQDLADRITSLVVADTSPLLQKWQSQIQKLLNSATTLEELRDRLPELYGKLNDTRFANQLMQKRMLADLGGRLEILEETKQNGDK